MPIRSVRFGLSSATTMNAGTFFTKPFMPSSWDAAAIARTFSGDSAT